MQCLKCSSSMKETLTRKGVLIDICSACEGVWLDQGEINFFTKNKHDLYPYETLGLLKSQSIPHKCPKCLSNTMRTGQIPKLNFQVGECSKCFGIYLDKAEFNKLKETKGFQSVRPDRSKSLSLNSLQKVPLNFSVKLPSLGLATAVVCFSLYGILFAFIVFLMEMGLVSLLAGSFIFIGIVALQFYFSPIIMDWQLRFFGSLSWKKLDHLPANFKNSLVRLCKENRLPIPKIGIINDNSPQAYTYGRTPYSSRVVISKGMFEILDEEELSAVLAHELGHIKHWDFIIMTVIKVVPLLFYIIYSSSYSKMKSSIDTRVDTKGSGVAVYVALLSYAFYLISEYFVLFVSRVREYHADRFSSFATKKPNKLLTALVKVSYGLLPSKPSSSTKEKSSTTKDKKSLESFNIIGSAYSKNLSLIHHETESNFSSQNIREIMKWDMWSPWAKYYELNSTHPLTAKRINAIASYAIRLKQEPYVHFKQNQPESYWDDFFIDITILLLPVLLGMIGFFVGYQHISNSFPLNIFVGFITGLFGLSLGALIRTIKTYPYKKFSNYSISALLKLIKVSPVRSYPVRLKGYILGRGDAGNIFSEDMVLKDQTGMIFLDHEPFGLNILFALFSQKKFQGKNVTVTGWYRRAPIPYIEIKKIYSPEASSQSYTSNYKMIFCLLSLMTSAICFALFV